MITDPKIRAALKSVHTEDTIPVESGGRGGGTLVLLVRRFKAGPTATFVARWKRGGQRASLTLGRYPELSLADARRRYADDIVPALLAGRDPRVVVATEGEATVARLFRAYVDDLAAKGKRSWRQVEHALLTGKRSAAKALGETRLAKDIGEDDVAAVLSTIYHRGAPVAADRTRAYMSAAFAWGRRSTHDYRVAARRDWGLRTNPAAGLPRVETRPRERNLTAGELRALWHGGEGPGFAPETTAAIRLLIACGQRVRETLRLDGCEVDLAAALWNMPAAKTKGGKRPHTIPLAPQAVAVLRQLVAMYGDGPLFPGGRGGGERMTDAAVNRALRRWADANGVAPFQSRDLRRTWKSRTADAGIDRFTRDLLQQHARGDTGSKHYDQADYLPQMREAMAKWAAWLDEQIVNEPASSVDVSEREAA